MLHQNNTCPIMAGGCHVVMTENVVIKGENMKSQCPRRCLTTSLCWGDVQNYFRPYSLFVTAFPAHTGGFDSFTLSIPARSADARDRMATQQPGRATFVELEGSRAAEAGSHIPRVHRRNSYLRLSNSMKTPPFALGCGCKRLPSSVRVPPRRLATHFPTRRRSKCGGRQLHSSGHM